MTTDHPDIALLAYFFRSCVSFFNAKPWKILGENDDVRISFDLDLPFLATTSGASAGAPGLSIATAYSAADLAIAADEGDLEWTRDAFSGHRLSVVFGTENEAPEWLREARRANKWPLASPTAFPTCFASDESGATRELQEHELRDLAVAVSVMAAFVATRRKQIQSREPHADAVRVRDDAGAERIALVQFPFDPNAPDGWQSYKINPGAHAHGNPAYEDVWNAALDLPDASKVLDRLVWSFFQCAEPAHLEDEDDWDEAFQRFLTWAIFTYQRDGETLAVRGLRQLAVARSNDELEVHRRVVKPRVGIFRVLQVKRNVGMQLYDVLRPGTFDVVERVGTRGLRAGNGLLGMLHPISDTQWILSPGASTYPSIPDMTPEEGESSDLSFAPTMEAETYGASADWIQEIPLEHLPDVYESFAEAIAETDNAMPAYNELQQVNARAAQPSQVAQNFAARVWWSDGELKVMLAFVMRIWNATPREELGGKSPDEMSASGNRVRAKRPTGGRRRT
ncbi:MAG: hypothetical protein H7Z40_14705 [Phycisphaerae bacterium]|nr:hypothetical protein [Gemmatimonadaceae bacterium]